MKKKLPLDWETYDGVLCGDDGEGLTATITRFRLPPSTVVHRIRWYARRASRRA